MKLFGFPTLGAQYTVFPVTGKSSWSRIPYFVNSSYPTSNFSTVISNLSKVVCIVFDNQSNLYVSCDGAPNNQLLKFNSSFQQQPFVSDSAWVGGPVGTLPVAMAFNQDYSALYVVNFASNNLTVIQMTDFSYQQVNLVGLGGNTGVGYRLNAPNGLTFDATFSFLVATNIADANLVQIVLTPDGTSGTVAPFCPTAPLTQPVLITTNENNGSFFVSNLSTNQIVQVANTGANYSVLSSSIPSPRGVSFNPNNFNYLWVTSLNTIVQVNLSTAQQTSYTDPLFNNPRGVLFDGDNYLYVANFGNGANTSSILRSNKPVLF